MFHFNPILFLTINLVCNRLTYEATLAELTSLEEMMRIMMEDGQIHPDVVAKHWQVYSMLSTLLLHIQSTTVTPNAPGSDRPLPRSQRRGAVIILGMLALAKRGVVADRVETLVRVGLGNLGKVRQMFFRSIQFVYVLIRHTTIG